MPRGRPRKPSAIRELEGNRSRSAIPPDLPLHGLPECPRALSGRARDHFNFVVAELGSLGVVKRLDTEALSIMADLWRHYWRCSDEGDVDGLCKVVAKWHILAGKFGLSPADRAKLLIGATETKSDPIESKFFQITG